MKRIYFVSSILLIGIALRSVHLITPYLDSDQAIVGLMARHILDGEFPIFYWGEHYCGPVESYLAAIIFYLFGSSRLTLNLSPFIFSLIFILLIYRLTKEMFNEKVALMSMLIVCASPPYLIWSSVLARGNYIENLAFGALLLLMTHRFITKVSEERKVLRYYILIGFTGGLAWWVNFQIVYFLFTTFIFMFLKEGFSFIKRGIIYLFPSFMIGSSLFWYYNLKNSWASILDIQKYSERLTLPESLASFFKLKLPHVLGPFSGSPIEYLNKYFIFIYGALLLYFILTQIKKAPPTCHSEWRSPEESHSFKTRFFAESTPSLCSGQALSRKTRFLVPILSGLRMTDEGLGMITGRLKITGTGILLLFLGIFSVIIIGWYNLGTSSRYYLSIYAVFPLVLAASLYNFRRVLRPIPILLMIPLTVANLYGALKSADLFDPKRLSAYKEDMKRNMMTFDLLERLGLKYVANTNYWQSYKLTFDSAERVIFAPPTLDWTNKYPKYTEALNSFRNQAYLWKGKFAADNFEKNLISEGMIYTKEKVRNFYIFHSLEISPRRGKGLPVTDMIATSNYASIDPARALDRDIITFWQPNGDKGGEVFFQVDMKRPYTINRVSILNVMGRDGNPAGYELEVSIDGVRWKKVLSLPVFFGSFVEGPDGIPILDPNWMISVFEPIRARYVKIKQASGGPAMNWCIAEVFIYSPSVNRSEDEEALIKEWLRESPEIVLNIDFGAGIRFLGYEIDKKKVNPGDSLGITYYWKATGNIKKDWHAFVHFIGPAGKIIFQNDHLLQSFKWGRIRESSNWIKGAIYKEAFKIRVPENVEAGDYKIRVGLWDPKTGKRLKVKTGLLKKMDQITIGEIKVR